MVTEDGKQPRRLSKLKQVWYKAGLDWPTLRTMLKAGIAPTIALAMFQADAVADQYSTLGYLMAIATLLSVPIMPRAKFLETMFLNILSVCVGASISLLALWTSVQARKHTTPVGASLEDYNSSAAVVCAIWLIFEVYFINSMRSYLPQYIFPGILTSIFAVVSLTYGVNFYTEAECISFAKRLLEAFLTGFAIATGVSLFIFPLSSRQVVFKEMTAYLGALRGLLKAQTSYMESLESIDMFRNPVPEAKAVKAAVAGLKGLQGKLALDVVYAKRDLAWGHLQPGDISEITNLLRHILFSLVGMTSMIDILHRIGEMNGWSKLDSSDVGIDPEVDRKERKAVRDWQNVVRTLHEPFQAISHQMDDAMEHILLQLGLKKRPGQVKKQVGEGQTNVDVEAKGEAPLPGSPGFIVHYEKKVKEFYENREGFLKDWCKSKGIELPPELHNAHVNWPYELEHTMSEIRHDQRQLLIFLYMEWLLWSTSNSILDLVRFADLKVADGTMTEKRLIYPGRKRFRKWMMNIFNHNGVSNEEHYDVPNETSEQDIAFGEALRKRKDPEHLPPVNLWQRAGDHIRRIPKMLRSDHSVFGFRVACAVMSLAIMAFLKNTYTFFLVQRLFWAAIMVAISMNRLAGQSVFNFSFRVLGTFVAMTVSIVIYYIVDGHVAGILVFEYVWICCCFYIVVKYPRFIVVGMISSVTSVLILGYELQVKKIGVVVATSNLQAYYPIYELAPYRLATVAGGLFVAFIWTIFPYAISEHSQIRRDLGMTLYLLANHYASVHETIVTRVRGIEGDQRSKNSPTQRLDKARMGIYARGNLIIARMKLNSSFQRWQVRLGGKFPADLYNSCITSAESILQFAALLAYSSKTFTEGKLENKAWQRDFTKLLNSLETTSEEVTTRLCLLSNSISNGIALPPNLQPIEPYGLLRRMESLDKDILSINHVIEPGYAAFAVMQIASRNIVADLNKLTDNVREIVGELDFSFHVVSISPKVGASTSSPSPTSSRTSEPVLDGKAGKSH